MLYIEKPNIVKVVIGDESGSAERFIIGQELGAVLANIDAAFAMCPIVKTRKPRRTKEQIAAYSNSNTNKTEEPAGTSVWPESKSPGDAL